MCRQLIRIFTRETLAPPWRNATPTQTPQPKVHHVGEQKLSLEGKVAVITGASSGIGAALIAGETSSRDPAAGRMREHLGSKSER